ncbi:MAG: phosphatase PAP2 family protein [Bacilli bacterium]|nr:phosphatase PAP2 family protein [Bacilli bacterium]
MKNIRNIIMSVIMTIFSGVFVYLVKTVDVKAIGPNKSSVGFSGINKAYADMVGSNMTIYKLTEIFGLLVFIIVGIYGLIGIYQLFKRKSLFKVDREIIGLGILYVLMISVYLIFDKIAINYRPIIIDGELEPSFPSSHTVLAICTCVSSLMVYKKYVPSKFNYLILFSTVLLLTLVFLGRTISGVHWISDILGGVIISLTLLTYFYTIIKWKKTE